MWKLLTATKIVLLTIFAVSLIGVSSANAQKKWFFGLGTGMAFNNAKGDQNLNTTSFGPIETEVDMDPSDFKDLMETGFGLGGYATDGTWIIQASFGKIKLGDDPSGSLPADVGGGTFSSDFFFETIVGEFTVGHTAFRSKDMRFSLTPYAGARYIKHELGLDLSVTQGTSKVSVSEDVDQNWTDVLLGTSVGYRFSPQVTWSAQVDAGFGGSDGTYTFKTSLSWKPLKQVSLGPNFKYSKIKYENESKGDSDWYLYDAKEWGAGFGVLYHF